MLISDLLLDRDLTLKALRFLRHRGHQVLVLHVADPGRARSRTRRRDALPRSGKRQGRDVGAE
ncbi:MAG: hypothetical protein V9E87_03830 [Gemmatimonadales bacterium]